MPSTIKEQIKTRTDNISSLGYEEKLNNISNLQPWNEITVVDLIKNTDLAVDTINQAYDNHVFDEYPFNILQSLNNTLNTVHSHLNQFINSKNQAHFQNAIQQVEALRTNLRTWGIDTYTLVGMDFQDKVDRINDEYQSLIAKGREIDNLKENVQKLIEPAVAGSLSKSFNDRKISLEKSRRFWLILAGVSAVISIAATILVARSLIDGLNIKFPENCTAKQIDNIIKTAPNKSILILIRIGILFPIYTLFGYVYNQYTKERNLEEEYAHRAAVASSLPNYGDLAVDPSVKDQIISNASSVVFESPNRNKKSTSKSKEDDSAVKSILDSLTSVLKAGKV